MSDVTPNFKDNRGACQCDLEGCELYGTLKRPWSTGQRCVRGCVCRRCLGKRSRAKGDLKARQARKALRIPGANSRHEEVWGGLLRVEVKAGKVAAGPVWTKYLASESQSERSRPFGDTRPFAAVFMLDGSSDGLICFRVSRLAETVAALSEQLFGDAA